MHWSTVHDPQLFLQLERALTNLCKAWFSNQTSTPVVRNPCFQIGCLLGFSRLGNTLLCFVDTTSQVVNQPPKITQKLKTFCRKVLTWPLIELYATRLLPSLHVWQARKVVRALTDPLPAWFSQLGSTLMHIGQPVRHTVLGKE